MIEDAALSYFGKKVQAARNEQQISQEKLAELSKLDRTYISSVERGQRNISVLNIIKIADALGVKASSLLEGIGGKGIGVSSIDKAFDLYSRHIYDEEKIRLLEENNLKIAGSVPSVLWELFGAFLTERYGRGITGADLQGWEVKSAKEGGSYEYQYHLNTGAEKLKEDCKVNHLFCAYSATYKDVIVRVMRGKDLADKYFKIWEPEYLKNYDVSVPDSKRRQRFRKSIPYGFVEKNGELVLEIRNSKLTLRNDAIITEFNKVR